MNTADKKSLDFIRQIVADDIAAGRNAGRVHTRFPPEPNGYLHIGHAKAICLNFGIAEEFGGVCNLRFDDTNPTTEETEYVDSIQQDVRWLGFEWADRKYFASDIFDRLYEFAEQLIRAGKAYVCSLPAEKVSEYRGRWNEPGKDSPDRNRPVEENLELFRRMRAGEFADGQYSLRAKIDMASPNMNLRDPAMYRIRHAHHHRTGTTWCIYPTYDWTHGQNDSLEGITHSLCTLEFEDHRPLYDWFIEQLGIHAPQQIEFARLNLTYTVMSKRKLLELVKGGYVDGWDDPRMPTLCGLRRRGYTPESIRNFCQRIGVTKANSTTDLAVLEQCVREHLNATAPRMMAVLRPLKVVLTNYPVGPGEMRSALNNPEDPAAGSREVHFGRELFIEQEDFMENPPKDFYRLGPGREVRLRYGYVIRCDDVVRGPDGRVVELHCTYDPETGGGQLPPGRKVKSILHWVSARDAVDAEVRMYDVLSTLEHSEDVPAGKDWKELLNPNSLEVLRGCKLEANLASAHPGARYQFERMGYFCADSRDCRPERLVFNRTVTLKDRWAKHHGKEPRA